MAISIIILLAFLWFVTKEIIECFRESKNSQTRVGRTSIDDQIYFDDDTWLDVDPALRKTPSFQLKPGRKVKVTITYIEEK